MALTCSKKTLSYHQSRQLTQNRDMSHVPLHDVSAQLKGYCESCTDKNVKPEREALTFYGLNHAMSVIRSNFDLNEELPPAQLLMVQEYYKSITHSAARAFYYLLIICTREARHNQSLKKDSAKIAKLFGATVASFHSMGSGESGIHNALLSNPPVCTVGEYVDSLAWVFYNCQWNSSYGGKAWGRVTDCLVNFVHGRISAEMMVDTVWTLAHNNGPIFNKGHLYAGYDPVLYTILDVQRSGQIPELILHDPVVTKYATPALKAQMLQLSSWQKANIGAYVDYFKVEALGSKLKYGILKEKQIKDHGISDFASVLQKEEALLMQAKKQADAKKHAAYEKKLKEKAEKEYSTGDGTVLDKITMVREGAAVDVS